MDSKPAAWSRDTPWHQGRVLCLGALQEMQLLHPISPQCTCAIVISHDCDVVNPDLKIEPEVEIIIGRYVDKQDGNYSCAKAPRTLHLEILHQGASKVLELKATAKRQISKTALQQLFEKTYFDQTTETWSGIALTSCDAICEDGLTVGKAKLLTQAPFEHMSLKAEP
jgi:hypothetical protein